MIKDEPTIRSDIENYIDRKGETYSSWYVGIAEDARDRLFREHNVDEKNGSWIYRNAASRTIAERITKYFVNQLGTKGNPGDGNDATTSVYAYKISYNTKE
jgi:hypothetical protein